MRMLSPRQSEFIAAPGWVTLALVLGNLAAYFYCYHQAGAPEIPAKILLQSGGLSAVAVHNHELWRYIAYGFLHASPLPLAINMTGLLLWGGLTEKYLGPLQYLLLYAFMLAAAGFMALYLGPAKGLVTGAAGAVAGLFGALLAMFLLGRSPLPLSFFAVTIAFIAALAFITPKAGWSLPLSGLAAGFLGGGLFGLIARFSDPLLRCRFPEWVKLELAFALALATYALADTKHITLSLNDMTGILLVVAGSLIAVKLVDIILSMRRGLALVAILQSVVYAAVPFVFGSRVAAFAAGQCRGVGGTSRRVASLFDQILTALCTQQRYAVYAVASAVFIMSMLVHLAPLKRGLRDVGFVGAGLRGDRRRANAA